MSRKMSRRVKVNLIDCLKPIDEFENTLFHSLAGHEDWEKFQKMWCQREIHHIMDENKKNKNGITPLHIAALKGHLKTCELIVACHVQDKNPADNDGITPLCCAVRKNHIKICELLLENVKNKLRQKMSNKSKNKCGNDSSP